MKGWSYKVISDIKFAILCTNLITLEILIGHEAHEKIVSHYRPGLANIINKTQKFLEVLNVQVWFAGS